MCLEQRNIKHRKAKTKKAGIGCKCNTKTEDRKNEGFSLTTVFGTQE